MGRFYITTPLYYVNDKPHIGTAYSTIMADVLNRYHKLFGEETFFLTGTDEHGQKCQQAAAQRGLSPQEHCDDMVKNFVQTWQELNIDYDIFFRTTTDWHKKAVQDCLQELFAKGDIYADTYEGWYSVSEEIFYTEKDLVDGKSPTGKEVQKISEKNYFFRMSKYQQRLIDYINTHPQFIQPDSRRNEVLGFLRNPLGDLCISRPKSRLNWGIEIPFDTEYVTYVWFDALLNYATGIGFKRPGMENEFKKWWSPQDTGPIHLLGKDILTTHAVYWTCMLMALEIELPQQIFAHGWILNKDQAKMSKSEGDVINPLEMKNIVGTDGLRYYLVRDVHLGNDAPISHDLVVGRINTELANNLGNLYSRTTNLIAKFFNGLCPQTEAQMPESQQLKTMALITPDEIRQAIENMNPSQALEKIVLVMNEANRYLETKAPWKLAKEDLSATGEVLHTALESLRVCAILLQPVMPEKMNELLNRLGCKERSFEDAKTWTGISGSHPIEKGEPLFPRIS